jgi:hypothetical protein
VPNTELQYDESVDNCDIGELMEYCAVVRDCESFLLHSLLLIIPHTSTIALERESDESMDKKVIVMCISKSTL